MMAWRGAHSKREMYDTPIQFDNLDQSSPIAGELFLNLSCDESAQVCALQMVREGFVASFPFLLRLALWWWWQQTSDSPQIEWCLGEVVFPF
jgi:hypothetical protein